VEIAQVVLNLLGNAADAVEGSKLRTVRSTFALPAAA